MYYPSQLLSCARASAFSNARVSIRYAAHTNHQSSTDIGLPQIIALSFACSWLGAYTSCQIISHANSVGRGRIWWAWVGLASLTFGWVSIWSLHFLGTLSAEMDVPIELDRSLTVLSAVVATGFTFAAFSSDSGSSRSHGWCRTTFWRKHFRGKKYIRDTEQRSLEEGLLERRLSNEFSDAVQERTAAIRHDATERGRLIAGEETIDPDVLIAAGLEDEFVTSPTLVETANFSADALLSEESTSDSVPARPPRLPGLPSSTISSSDSHSRSGLTTSSGSGLEFPTELSSDPELHLLLNRTTKKRLISGAYRAQLTPTAFLNEIYEGFNLFIAFKGGVWAVSIFSRCSTGFFLIACLGCCSLNASHRHGCLGNSRWPSSLESILDHSVLLHCFRCHIDSVHLCTPHGSSLCASGPFQHHSFSGRIRISLHLRSWSYLYHDEST